MKKYYRPLFILSGLALCVAATASPFIDVVSGGFHPIPADDMAFIRMKNNSQFDVKCDLKIQGKALGRFQGRDIEGTVVSDTAAGFTIPAKRERSQYFNFRDDLERFRRDVQDQTAILVRIDERSLESSNCEELPPSPTPLPTPTPTPLPDNSVDKAVFYTREEVDTAGTTWAVTANSLNCRSTPDAFSNDNIVATFQKGESFRLNRFAPEFFTVDNERRSWVQIYSPTRRVYCYFAAIRKYIARATPVTTRSNYRAVCMATAVSRAGKYFIYTLKGSVVSQGARRALIKNPRITVEMANTFGELTAVQIPNAILEQTEAFPENTHFTLRGIQDRYFMPASRNGLHVGLLDGSQSPLNVPLFQVAHVLGVGEVPLISSIGECHPE